MARGPSVPHSGPRVLPGRHVSLSSTKVLRSMSWKLLKDKVTSPQELLLAVETLYADELCPDSRILKRRLVERNSKCGLRTVDIDASTLRAAVCEVPRLVLREGTAGDWSAELCDRTATFVDVHDHCDPFP